MNKQKIAQEVMEVLNDYEWNYSSNEIDNLVDRWAVAKDTLRNILSKHPNWNDDAQAVILTYKDERRFDKDEYLDRFQELIDYIYSSVNYYNLDQEQQKLYQNLKNIRYYVRATNIDENHKSTLSQLGYKANIGQKTSRVIAKIVKGTYIEALPEWNKYFAKLADVLSPIIIERQVLLSIHPCDFLLMSKGNSWESCHNIENGCYMTGTLSYMGDETSMILYTIDKEYSGDKYFSQPKINRQVFCYSDNMILQSRLYPDEDRYDSSTSENKYTNLRNLVQSIFAEGLGVPNLWSLEKEHYKFKNRLNTDDNSMHYRDYNCDDYGVNLSTLKDYEPVGHINIGSACYCIKCGEQLDDHESLLCDHCDRNYQTCSHCGEEFPEDSGHWIDDELYCSNCVTYCPECNSYHLTDNMTNTYNGFVCQDCLDSYYRYSEHNNEYYRDCDVMWIEDEEDYYLNSEVVKIEGIYYIKKTLKICRACGRYLRDEDVHLDDNGMVLCETCHYIQTCEDEDCEICSSRKFRIGDIITGKGYRYGITTCDAIMIIVDIERNSYCNSDDIRVEVIDHNIYPSDIGSRHWVNSEYFVKVNKEIANRYKTRHEVA